jgi:hypothetical protein
MAVVMVNWLGIFDGRNERLSRPIFKAFLRNQCINMDEVSRSARPSQQNLEPVPSIGEEGKAV